MIRDLWHSYKRFPAKQWDAILTHIAAHSCLAISCLFYHSLCQYIQPAILPQMLGDTKFALPAYCCHLSNSPGNTLDEYACVEKIRYYQYSPRAKCQTALQTLRDGGASDPGKCNFYCAIVPAFPQEPRGSVDLSICLGIAATALYQEYGSFW